MKLIAFLVFILLSATLGYSAVFEVSPFKDTDNLPSSNATKLTVFSSGTGQSAYFGYNITSLPKDQILVLNSTWRASYDVTLTSPGSVELQLLFNYNNTWNENVTPSNEEFGAETEIATQVFTGIVTENDNRTYTFLDEAPFVANFYDRNVISLINQNKTIGVSTSIGVFARESNRSANLTFYTLSSSARQSQVNDTSGTDTFFDFESLSGSASYFDYSDFSYSPSNNTIMPNSPIAFVTSESNTSDTLLNVNCRAQGGLYQNTSHVSAINIPAGTFDVFCFNLTGQHQGNEWYGAIKVLNASPTNFTFISALYAPAFNVTVAPTPTPTPTPTPAPSGANANIISVSISDPNPIINQEITITTKVENTGNTSTLVLGQSIGNVSGSFVFCDINCYSDNLGDFRQFNVSAGGTIDVTRRYIIRDSEFNVGDVLEVVTTVRDTNLALLDKNISFDAITIVSVASKLDAFAISVDARPARVVLGDTFRARAFIFSNSSISYPYVVGMSIGIWNISLSQSGQPLSVEQTPLIPPCNTGCFSQSTQDILVDGFIPAVVIPPNFTDPTPTLIFEVPNYFLEQNGFMLAVSVRSGLPSEGGELISVTYFANVSFVGLTPDPVAIPNLKKGASEFTGDLLGIDVDLALIVLSMIVSIIISVLATTSTQNGTIGVSAFVGMIIVFTIIGFLPLVIGIILILIAGFIAMKLATSGISGA